MMRTLTFIFLLFSIISCNTTSRDESSLNSSEKEKYPHDFMFMQRAYPTGEIKTNAYADAIQWKRNVAQRNNGLVWEFSGPENIGGRISDIEIPSTQGQTYYVGAASGGIFKTTDAGATWQPIFDEQEVLSIGDIEISKNNNDLVWVGTGEVNAGGGSLAYDGDGIYKSTDGGLTWQVKGLPDVGSIGKILLDPNDDNTIFVGAMGPLFRNDTNRGVYRSTDGGDTWEQKLFVSDSTGVIDMAIHPSNGDIVYAASWERIRRPERRQYGGATSRLYRSLDGGDSWTEMTNGLPSAPSQKGRISIDISQSNPSVLYARYADANGSIQGVYKTTNGGDSWTTVNSSQLTNIGFHWWFGGIFIDPTDENTLYNVDFIVEKSTDGGNNWATAFPDVHVDQHAMAFNTMVPGVVLLGNDGGLYKSTNNGASSVKDVTLPITQFYRFHVDAQNDNKLYGGAQDNSTMRTTTGGLNNWDIITGGDGFQPLVDPTNTNVIYALSQYGNLVKSTNDAASFFGATNGISNSDRKNWDTPIAFDPINPQIMYYGANRLYKSTDGANNWSVISPDLTNGSVGGNLTFGTIISISVSPIHTDTIYVGTDDGNVWITQDGGANWNNISGSLPNRWVTKVLASRDDINSVYVTFSGYRYGEDDGHIYRSTNNGASWTNISNSLPDIPVNDIEQDVNGNLFIGTDIGVLASGSQGFGWEVLGSNLPAVVVTDLYIHEGTQYLYAGTYGRSSYKIDISSVVLGNNDNSFEKSVILFPNPASEYVNITLPQAALNTSVLLYDSLGRIVKTQHFSKPNKTINLALSGVSEGIYYLKITQGAKKATKKLLIK
ncbi:putative secreted protein (Por secretion system target) [Ulvibacter sp. MAR_2010_11]|uniref:T9SS type A sorting domain-containing protein n=1 Tax=Ulvibacter sp. MAR_2010_11 TaxID=1250229 RepID=UPI000C2C3B19|nr:T9SS type A sorting domain-containing protein [Ulvibacter sp. MAR_2010_11]PKA83417.1 putative secreted protein (Por secretion system target) [Ulvibacter sp. MAR_2010_11]